MNRKSIAAFALGILLTAVGFLWWGGGHDQKPAESPAAPPAEAQAPATERAVSIQPSRPKYGVQRAAAAPANPHGETIVEVPSAPSSQGLVLSEETVQRMEVHLTELRAHAYTESLQDGWRVRILPEDRILLTAGLQDGDVVTYESVDEELRKPDRAALARRFVAVLNQIAR